MSDKTKSDLDQAIRAHMADEIPESMATGYFLTTTGVMADNANHTAMLYELADGQPFVVTIGLAEIGRMWADGLRETGCSCGDDD